MTTVPHPAYSPDLAPCDFYVFPKTKLRLKGRHRCIQAEGDYFKVDGGNQDLKYSCYYKQILGNFA